MRIAVTGGSGFIGSRFISLFGGEFDEVIVLNSKNAPLNDYGSLCKLTKSVDVIVHCAFDHSYKTNIIGIQNILKVCDEHKIKKLVYLSTISVYDPDIKGVLKEDTLYSQINDPYSKEKRNVEFEIDKNENPELEIVILQPAIVYGLGGNWTKYAVHACKSTALRLPSSGEKTCNAVYVADVAKAIFNSCDSSVRSGKILVSGKKAVSWKDFYYGHNQVLNAVNVPSNLVVVNDSSTNDFHPNFLINIIFTLWFNTPIGKVFNLFLVTLKKLRAKSYSSTQTNKLLKIFLKSDIAENILQPVGITKKVHFSCFKVDHSAAKNLVGYYPDYSFYDGMKKVEEDASDLLA